MPEGWRFRTGLRGRLVLQRLVTKTVHIACYYHPESHEVQEWLDAKVEDLHLFFLATQPQNHDHQ